MGKLKDPRKERLAQARALGKTLEECSVAAGYAGHAQSAHRMLKDVEVDARVTELQDQALKVTTKTLEDAMHELQKLAFSSLGKFFTIGEDGLPEISFEGVDADDACALADLQVDDVTVGGKITCRVRLKLHDKAGALIKFIELKIKQREREEERAALEAKTINGTLAHDGRADYLAELADRYRLSSLPHFIEEHKNMHSSANGKGHNERNGSRGDDE